MRDVCASGVHSPRVAEKPGRPEYPHDETQRNDQPQQQAAGHQQDDRHDRFERLPTCLKRTRFVSRLSGVVLAVVDAS
jgi:hypothetical protein